MTLFDMQGNLMLQRNNIYNAGSSVIDLDLSSVASGVYVLTVRQGAIVLQQRIV
jgi:hypothetical protein